jgi:hypothetical protein
MIVCLRDGKDVTKEAVEQLPVRAIYPLRL